MKKFFLALCALIVGMAANAEEYYLIGNFNSWKSYDENAHFTKAEDGTYVLDYNGTLTTGFKINNGSWTTGVNYGTNGSNLVVGETYSLKYNADDIAVASSIANPHCVLDVENWTLTITTTSGPVESVISYAIHGQIFGNTSWSTTDMTEAEDGTWTLTANVVAGNFGIKKLENGSQIAWYSSASGTEVKVNEAMSVKQNGSNWSSTLEGEYTFVFDPEAMTLTIQGEAPVDPDPVDPEYSFAIHGSVFTGEWESHYMAEAEDGTWTLTATLVAGEFGIKKLDSKGEQVAWYAAQAGMTEAVVGNAMTVAAENNANWKSTLAGEYTFVFDPEAMTLTITGEDTPVDPVDPEYSYAIHGSVFTGEWESHYMAEA
ncbi:MAG: hypothetical protein ACI4AM_05090, partial [Muribaculaceae bacterium]